MLTDGGQPGQRSRPGRRDHVEGAISSLHRKVQGDHSGARVPIVGSPPPSPSFFVIGHAVVVGVVFQIGGVKMLAALQAMDLVDGFVDAEARFAVVIGPQVTVGLKVGTPMFARMMTARSALGWYCHAQQTVTHDAPRMSKPGYLHHWINKNYRLIWRSRSAAPRFLGIRGAAMWEQESYRDIGKFLVARFGEDQLADKHVPIQFEILNLATVGAWLVWPENCYGVLVTRGLIRKLHRVAWEIQDAFPKILSVPTKKVNTFNDLWAELPKDEAHFHILGSFISTIAFSFIIHHELAHACLGHEGFGLLHQPAGKAVPHNSMVSAYPDFIDEFASVYGTSEGTTASLGSQALETDADVHGMFYARSFMLDQAQLLCSRTPQNGDLPHLVGRTLLRDANCQQLVLFMGVAVGLLTLLSDLEADRVRDATGLTHPPVPSRLLLAFHVAGSLVGYSAKYWENRSAAITLAIAAITAFEASEPGHSSRRTKTSEADRLRQTSSGDSGRSLWQTLSHISIVDAMLNTRELGPYWETLVAEVRKLAPLLAPFSRFPDSLRYEWHRLSSPDGNHSKQ